MTDKSKTFSLTSAIICLFYGIFNIFNQISFQISLNLGGFTDFAEWLIDSIKYDYFFEFVKSLIPEIFVSLSFILLAILLFADKSGKLFFISSIPLVIVSLYYLINYFCFTNVAYLLTTSSLLFVFIYNSYVNKSYNSLHFLAFIPTILGVTYFLSTRISNIEYILEIIKYDFSYFIKNDIKWLSNSTLFVITLLSISLFLFYSKKNLTETDKKYVGDNMEQNNNTENFANIQNSTTESQNQYDTTKSNNANQPAPSQKEGYIDLILHVVLLLFTCGIYQFIWIFRATDYLNKAKGFVAHTPINQLLLNFFVPFYYVYWTYDGAKRIDTISREKNIPCDIATTCLILSIFFVPVISFIIMQSKINAISESEK